MRTTRLATADDAAAAARMLHDFNSEFDSPTPGVEFLTARLQSLIGSGDVTVVLAGDDPAGVAVHYEREL